MNFVYFKEKMKSLDEQKYLVVHEFYNSYKK